MNQENVHLSFYQKQAQIILQEISRGALMASKMTIRIDHHCFKADGITANIRRQYIDTRTQANLSKLNANRRQDIDVVTEDMSNILGTRAPETVGRLLATASSTSPIWCSPRLEVIALKWTSIMIILVASMVLLWASLVLTESL